MIKELGLIFLVSLFLFLRLFNLEKGVNFSAEQGVFLRKAWEIYKTRNFTLLGPPTSIKSKISREFYQGPATYYLLIPPLVLFNGNPIAVSYYLVFLNLIALLILFFIIKKKLGNKAAFWGCFFFASFPQLVTFSRFVWNPNFLPLFSSILLAFLLGLKKKRGIFYFFLTGISLGLCLQFHYQAVLLIFLTLFWLFVKKAQVNKFFSLFLGLLLGFSPLIVFELRNDFYNLKTLFLILKTGTDKSLSAIPFYYFLSLVPFLILLTGLLVSKLFSYSKIAAGALLVFYCLWAGKKIYAFSSQPPGMPKDWNYPAEEKVVKIILEENKKKYNIASLLSGDTRTMATRYLLEIAGKEPLGIENYPQADWLFVLSRYNKERTKRDPVWEVSSFRPSKIVKQWPISKEITLYLFEKIEN